jgi:glutamine amidotransferase
MGWNTLQTRNQSPLLAGISEKDYFYFAHSYAATLTAARQHPSVVAGCEHGAPFVAVIAERNICAVQFHPEKSGEPGARLLRNFLRLAA